jgi:acyl carrier protein
LADLRQVLAEVFAVPSANLNDDMALSDIASWNSLMHIELVVRLEEVFHVELTQDDIVEMTSLTAIRAVLRQRGAVLD